MTEDDLWSERRGVHPCARYAIFQAKSVVGHEGPFGKAHEADVPRVTSSAQLAVRVSHDVVPCTQQVHGVSVTPLVGACAGIVGVAMVSEVVHEHAEAHSAQHECRHLLGVVVAVAHEPMLQHDYGGKLAPEREQCRPPSRVPRLWRRQPPTGQSRCRDPLRLTRGVVDDHPRIRSVECPHLAHDISGIARLAAILFELGHVRHQTATRPPSIKHQALDRQVPIHIRSTFRVVHV
mmetsp:Transcript_48680/g.139974  ORF Transcript_48680/g.139974 Transcript_48680/m.139974 type:complete len:235 (+) Transcript_48680:580-1284(+)